jgi:transposase
MGARRALAAGAQEDRPPRTTDLRDALDAIFYMATTGCQWAMIPNDFPPPSTVQRYFYAWRDSALIDGYRVPTRD